MRIKTRKNERNFAVMQHRGEIVEKAIRESGYSITKLATKLGKSRRWMYQIFDNPNLSIDVIIEIGEVIRYDFSTSIRSLAKYQVLSTRQTSEESKRNYGNVSSEVEIWKSKYLELLEKHNQLLQETSRIAKLKPAKKSKRNSK